MNKVFSALISVGLMAVCAASSSAGQIKAYVSTFAVTDVQHHDELKTALQTLLMSRLNSDAIVAVDNPAGSDITVSGSYVAFGKVYSIDAVAKNNAGSIVARAFVQSDNQDELIPAVGKLAKTLSDEVVKNYVLAASSQAVAAPAAQKRSLDIVSKQTVSGATSDVVRPQSVERSGGPGWVSQRIPGAMTGIAEGRTLESGEREIFITGARSLQSYRLGKDMKLISEVTLTAGDKILSVDAADLDNDGVTEIYLTVINADMVMSQVYAAAGGTLKNVAKNLPYFLRGIALNGKGKKMYAQEQGMDGVFYGDVHELAKEGNTYKLGKPLKLPRYGYLYNFNMLVDPEGKSYILLLNQDGYLVVYTEKGEQLWKSSDKFGGSELYFQRSGAATISPTISRMIFLDQRIIVTSQGDIIVPYNGGFWNVGNSRSYTKSSVVAFTWNGSALEEKWRTHQSQNYLSDFGYDEHMKELLLLEVVQKEGLVEKGASAVYLKKVE